MSNRIAWLEVSSTDVSASAEFYRDLFDWPIVTDVKSDYTKTSFGRGETGIGFTPVDETQGITPGSVLIYVEVDDIDAAIARAKELGAPIYQDKTEVPTGGRMAIVGDPGGNRIGFIEWSPAAS